MTREVWGRGQVAVEAQLVKLMKRDERTLMPHGFAKAAKAGVPSDDQTTSAGASLHSRVPVSIWMVAR